MLEFVAELRHCQRDFWQFLQQQDRKGLEAIAHKLHGACCYFGVPNLQTAVAQVELSARDLHDGEQLKQQVICCIEQIDLVLREAFQEIKQ